ncbi:MAG TPA: tripartite tricarboxylate transporter substrate binding protein, partial [Geminicoccaceae bacterium]
MFRNALLGAAVFAVALGAAPASAEYPEKPVTMIVPFSQGGATDQIARMFAEPLEKELGQPVVIVNQPGAGGAVGLANLAQARPDGYTIGIGSDSTLAARPLMSDSGYTHKSFQPIARMVEIPSGVAVRSDSPYQSLEDLVEAMKTEQLTWSSSGVGSGPHLAMAVFMDKFGVSASHVTSGGNKEALVKLLSGEVDFLSGGGSNFPPMLDESGQGDIRVLGLAGEERWQYLPDVPTYTEQGFPYLRSQWFALVGPKGMPEEAVDKLSAAVEKIVTDPERQELLAQFYFDPAYLNPEELNQQIEEEMEELQPTLDQAGLAKES